MLVAVLVLTGCIFLATGNVYAKGTHDYGAWKTVTAATCKSVGVQRRTCKSCGSVETRNIKRKDHVYSDWTTTKQATCWKEGLKVRTCKNCGKKDYQLITKNKALHDPAGIALTPSSKFVKEHPDFLVKEGTCTENRVVWSYCSICRGKVNKVKQLKNPDNHNWKLVSKYKYQCTRCKKTKSK